MRPTPTYTGSSSGLVRAQREEGARVGNDAVGQHRAGGIGGGRGHAGVGQMGAQLADLWGRQARGWQSAVRRQQQPCSDGLGF